MYFMYFLHNYFLLRLVRLFTRLFDLDALILCDLILCDLCMGTPAPYMDCCPAMYSSMSACDTPPPVRFLFPPTVNSLCDDIGDGVIILRLLLVIAGRAEQNELISGLPLDLNA